MANCSRQMHVRIVAQAGKQIVRRPRSRVGSVSPAKGEADNRPTGPVHILVARVPSADYA